MTTPASSADQVIIETGDDTGVFVGTFVVSASASPAILGKDYGTTVL